MTTPTTNMTCQAATNMWPYVVNILTFPATAPKSSAKTTAMFYVLDGLWKELWFTVLDTHATQTQNRETKNAANGGNAAFEGKCL